MENLTGKHFSITDPQGVNTVIYKVNKTEKEFLDKYPKYTVQRLENTEEFIGENKKKTFYIDGADANNESNDLVILSFAKEKVVVNMGSLENDKVKISKRPIPVEFSELYSDDEENVYKEFKYTPNFKRPISIIDPETAEEIKPMTFYDQQTEEIKGKCKIKPNKPYFVFEIREDN